jgi:hypothetical protein
VIRLDAATVLLQWASGGMLFLWVTTRRREVGLGYGWTSRIVYLLLAAGALVAGLAGDTEPAREVASAVVLVATALALGVSIQRKAAGVAGQRAEHDRRTARVAAMTGIDRTGATATTTATAEVSPPVATVRRAAPREYPPVLDLFAALVGAVGLVAVGLTSDVQPWLAVGRNVAGAAFLGVISDAMLLGHWYLVQPGLPRRLLDELVTWILRIWPIEVGLLLVPTGMISVLNGTIDDGWDGILGWMWVACAITTLVLALVTRAALKERYYSAVMAATGLLYLAILTGFGTDLVARAVLAS